MSENTQDVEKVAQVEPVFQHIQCETCDLVYVGEFAGEPKGPLPKQYCSRCRADTPHRMVEIEVVD